MIEMPERMKACDELNHDYEVILGIKFCRKCGHHVEVDITIREKAVKLIHSFQDRHATEIGLLEHSVNNELTQDEKYLFDLLDAFCRNECYFTGLNLNAATEPNDEKQLIVYNRYRLLYPIAKTTAKLEELIISGKAALILERFSSIKQ